MQRLGLRFFAGSIAFHFAIKLFLRKLLGLRTGVRKRTRPVLMRDFYQFARLRH